MELDGGGVGEGQDMQIDLPPALDIGAMEPQRKKWKSSEAQLVQARATRMLGLADKRLQAQKVKTEAALGDLNEIVAILPGAAEALGLQSRTNVVGRMKNLTPQNFRALCTVAFMPLSFKLNVGVHRPKLVFAARKLILDRQEHGFQCLLFNATAFRKAFPRREDLWITAAYNHEWDETSSSFKYFGPEDQIANRMGVIVQVLQQRGTVLTHLHSIELEESRTWTEQWMCAPVVVEGTTGEALLPGILQGMPRDLSFFTASADELRDALFGFNSFVFAPTCDAASGNLLILKSFGARLESMSEQLDNKLLYLPDTCQVHAHQRGKLAATGASFHTSRHFSLAKLLRNERVLRAVMSSVESHIKRRVRRVQAPPPTEHTERSELVLRFMYGLDGTSMQSANAVVPRKDVSPAFITDLRAMLALVNDDLTADEWVHYCHPGPDGKPCCKDEKESKSKVARAVLKILFGKAEQVPGEGKWTYMMKAFKRTLLRAMIHNCGRLTADMFPKHKGKPVEPQSVADDEPDEVAIKSLRIQRSCQYFSEDKNIHEVSVHVIVQRICDDLFYGLLGGVDRSDAPHKITDLLARQDSPITKCLAKLSSLLQGGFKNPNDEKWALLHMMKAPISEQSFRKFVLGQVLRMHSALVRRYSVKFAGWPFRLLRLCGTDWSEAEKQQVARDLLSSKPCCLDTFSRGFRKLFRTEAAVLSTEAARCAASAFDSMRVVTDFSERSHAQCRCASRSQTGPRAFSHTSNEVLLKQAMVVHTKNGGLPLSGLRKQGAKERSSDARLSCPLLHIPRDGSYAGVPEEQAALTGGGSGDVRGMQGGTHERGGLPPAVSAPEGGAGIAPAPSGQVGQLVLSGGAPRDLQALFQPFKVEQATGHAVETQDAASSLPEITDGDVGGEQRPRRGLNPLLQYMNRHLKAAKLAVGGRSLTEKEMETARQEARDSWANMTAETKKMHIEGFKDWQIQPVDQGNTPDQVREPYRCHWGGGSRRTAITPTELCKYIQHEEWPSIEQVYQGKQYRVSPTEAKHFDLAANSTFNLWGCLRRPFNICREGLRLGVQAELLNLSLSNWCDGLGNDSANRGNVLVLFKCELTADGPQGAPLAGGSWLWLVGILTGVCGNPRVTDWTMCKFDNEASGHMETLNFPCLVEVDTEECRLTMSDVHLRTMTSADLAYDLVEQRSCRSVAIMDATYTVMDDDDGRLNLLRIDGLNASQTLWAVDSTRPCIRRPVRPGPPPMRTGDPFAAGAAPGRPRAKAQGRGAGRSRAGSRGRAAQQAARMGEDIHALPLEDHPEALDLEAALGEMMDLSDREQSDNMTDGAIDELGFMDEELVQAADPATTLEQQAASSSASGIAPEIEEMEAAAVAVGLAEPGGVAGVALPSSDASPSIAPIATPATALGQMSVQDLVGPYPSGRVYYKDERCVASFIRGKPKNSLSVRCSFHPRCTWVLPERLAPTDDELKEWLLAVPPCEKGETDQERRRKAQMHIDLSKKWRQPTGTGAASSAPANPSSSSMGV